MDQLSKPLKKIMGQFPLAGLVEPLEHVTKVLRVLHGQLFDSEVICPLACRSCESPHPVVIRWEANAGELLFKVCEIKQTKTDTYSETRQALSYQKSTTV